MELCNNHHDLILEPDLLFKRSSWLLCGEWIIQGWKYKGQDQEATDVTQVRDFQSDRRKVGIFSLLHCLTSQLPIEPLYCAGPYARNQVSSDEDDVSRDPYRPVEHAAVHGLCVSSQVWWGCWSHHTCRESLWVQPAETDLSYGTWGNHGSDTPPRLPCSVRVKWQDPPTLRGGDYTNVWTPGGRIIELFYGLSATVPEPNL